MAFAIGDRVHFAGHDSVVVEIGQRNGTTTYLIENGELRIPMWIPEEILRSHQDPDRAGVEFVSRPPALIAVDDFFTDPDEIRAIALAQEYHHDERYFKGLRSTTRFLWPYMREELSRLVGLPVKGWIEQSANGCFQQTDYDDPLVWHHDPQNYAAAVYLNPDGPPSGGTSFWRDRVHGCRRAPTHPLEAARLGSPEAVKAAESVVYDPYNFTHPDNWELVESVAGLYNRLVVWDASLLHSATSYEPFRDGAVAPKRLVQLFFFDC